MSMPAGLIQQILAQIAGQGGMGGPGAGVHGLAPMAPGANFSRPTTQWGTPIPQQPSVIGPLSNLAMQIGRGTLNQWPPQSARPVMGGPTGANNFSWLTQQRQMMPQPMMQQPMMGAPPWMGPGRPGIQPVGGGTY